MAKLFIFPVFFSQRNQQKQPNPHDVLVGGLEHLDYFSHHIGNVIIPTDEVIFFRGVGQPPTSVQ